ncbi:VWA domain-containing protein [Roseitranquillus sediminis]|uniref:VWA domain-containing protein n=1 Tax=Roseitranquillus sediminis TaxID=2809051 RepID=UPI001D0C19EE|nr:VWA domain-containing protein [Roseitranquillus sediminis]MBM9595959.1 VWA domain-containing protein [Roseitranquillus sediminis]
MTFAAPAFLLLGGLVIVVWWLARRHPQRVVAPSITLWRQIAADYPVPRRRRWAWQNSLLTWLRVGAILAAALALARPIIGEVRPGEHWIVVLDASAAMHPAARFEALRSATAEEVADAGQRVGRTTLIIAGVAAEIPLARRLASERALPAALAAAALSDGPADWPKAVALAQAARVSGEPTQVVLAGPEVPSLVSEAFADADILHLVPEEVEGINRSLTATIAMDEDRGGLWHLEARVSLPDAAETTLAIRFTPEGADDSVEWATVPVRGGRSARTVEAEVELPGPGLLAIALPDDASPHDNVVRFRIRSAPAPFRVLVVGDEHDAIARGLAALPDVEVQHADTTDGARNFDLLVVDESFENPGTNVLRVVSDDETAVDVLSWQDDHVLADGLAWSRLRVDAASAVEPWPDATVLLRSASAPLIEARTTPSGREVRLAFSPDRSNWPELASFPVFLSRLVVWAGGPGSGLLAPICTVGLPCRVTPAFGEAEIALAGHPQDLTTAMQERMAAQIRYSDGGGFVPQRVGVLTFRHEGRVVERVVNPSPAETVASPTGTGETAGADRWPVHLWKYLAALFLGLALAHLVVTRRARGATATALGAAAVAAAALGVLDAPFAVPVAAHDVVVASATPPDDLPRNWAAVRLEGGPVAARDAGTSNLHDRTDTGYGAAVALRLATAMLPEGGRIALEPAAGLHPAALSEILPELRQRGIRVDHAPAEAAPNAGPALKILSEEGPVYAGDGIVLTSVLRTGGTGSAVLEVRRDGQVLGTQTVDDLTGGSARFETVVNDVPEGAHLFEVALSADGGRATAARVIDVRPPGRIAVIASEPAHGAALAGAMTAAGLDARALRPDEAPHYLDGWLAHDAVVLDNLPAIALTTNQQALIETAVRDHGLGLMLLGGDRSFGPGGYLETALDRLSPVSSRVPGEKPQVALAFVLDRSGSMQQPVGQGTRLDIAKSATSSAMDLLGRESEVAVIAFDEAAHTVVPRQTLDQSEAIKAALARITPGGGTSMLVGLERAYDEIAAADAAARHVIVLTDGLSQPAAYETLLARMREAGITVSSISIGQAPVPLVEQIALAGGGAFHSTSDIEALPSIMSQEAILLSGAPIEQGSSQPRWSDRSLTALGRLPDRMPVIAGFVLTSPKPEATMEMVTLDSEGREMPLLAHWRYGNGMVLALTTQIAGPWTRDWQSLPGYSETWASLLRQMLAPDPDPGFSLSSSLRGDTATVRLEVLDSDGQPLKDALPILGIDGPDGARTLPAREVQPGRYEAVVRPAKPGAHVVTAELDGRTGTHVLYVPAFASTSDPAPVELARLASALTGGRALDLRENARGFSGLGMAIIPGGLIWLGMGLALFVARILVDPALRGGSALASSAWSGSYAKRAVSRATGSSGRR